MALSAQVASSPQNIPEEGRGQRYLNRASSCNPAGHVSRDAECGHQWLGHEPGLLLPRCLVTADLFRGHRANLKSRQRATRCSLALLVTPGAQRGVRGGRPCTAAFWTAARVAGRPRCAQPGGGLAGTGGWTGLGAVFSPRGTPAGRLLGLPS